MVEIEFSVMVFSEENAKSLLTLLQDFEEKSHIHVKLISIPWVNGWAEIAKFGIYRFGPDISSIGTTWIGSLASMEALRPFTAKQAGMLGGAKAFFDASWRTGLFPNDETIWAIPWLADVSLIYYWEDAFEKAGIQDTQAAFATDAALLDTLEKLQTAGYDYPLALTTTATLDIVHEAAHWVWSAGGDFLSPDNRQAIFNQPAALAGFRNYFRLRPFISPKSLGDRTRDELFATGEAAIQFGGPYVGLGTASWYQPGWQKHMRTAQPSQTTFVGGTSFVVWKHSAHYDEAFNLVHFLLSQPLSIPASPHDQALPSRRESLNMPSAKTDAFHRTYLECLENGRSFPTMRLWGLVEDKLVVTISSIWSELFADPDQDLDACLHKHFDPLVERMNRVLEN